MKPKSPCEDARFPRTDFGFHSGIDRWRGGFWSAYGGEGESDRRRFYNFTREYLLESARERMKEAIVFGLVVLTAAWPLGYTMMIAIKLALKVSALDH